jgi:hypothetical protein
MPAEPEPEDISEKVREDWDIKVEVVPSTKSSVQEEEEKEKPEDEESEKSEESEESEEEKDEPDQLQREKPPTPVEPSERLSDQEIYQVSGDPDFDDSYEIPKADVNLEG